MNTYFPEKKCDSRQIINARNVGYFVVSIVMFLFTDYCFSATSTPQPTSTKHYSVTPQPAISKTDDDAHEQKGQIQQALERSMEKSAKHSTEHSSEHVAVAKTHQLINTISPAGNAQSNFTIAKNTTPNYQLSSQSADYVQTVSPELPDISQYTYDNVVKRKNAWQKKSRGAVVVDKMFGSDVLHDFTAGERATEWAKRQTSFPQAIYIRDGFVTLQDVAQALSDTSYFEKKEHYCIFRLPVVVEHSGALDLENDYCQQLRFSQDRGSFLAISGALFVLDTELVAWSEEKQQAALFEHKKKFRPFLVTWTGSELYIANSTIKSFGYHKSKSYGLSVANYSDSILHKWEEKHPIAWIIDSTFEDMYYGFYCYDSDNLVVLRNTYTDNVVYGIDPHDYSNNLIIAYNEVSGTQLKHGIIVSREVSNSWIFNNKSYNNKLSGFVLDRKSSNNLVANNIAMNNGSDGITFYESSDNLVYNNEVLGNKKHGIRARNSTNIHLQQNKIVANGSYGVYGHVKNLDNTERDFKLDPYTYAVSMTLNGDVISANNSGGVHIDKQNSIAMRDIELRFSKNGYQTYFGGSLEAFHNQIIEMLLLQNKVAVVTAVDNGGSI
ncbi:Poly(beta-D-mannuronate) C5 epimerase [Thalassocella blandensis]|nr:Poly(beta-D-mannuronate) C5 epimerase [Thalassocella blandensis]